MYRGKVYSFKADHCRRIHADAADNQRRSTGRCRDHILSSIALIFGYLLFQSKYRHKVVRTRLVRTEARHLTVGYLHPPVKAICIALAPRPFVDTEPVRHILLWRLRFGLAGLSPGCSDHCVYEPARRKQEIKRGPILAYVLLFGLRDFLVVEPNCNSLDLFHAWKMPGVSADAAIIDICDWRLHLLFLFSRALIGVLAHGVLS